jgi:hypothetical protein
MKKPFVIALFLAGLATAAVVLLGAGKIFHAILAIGLRGIAFVVAWQLFVFIILGLAWWIVLPKAPLWLVIWGRLVREGGGLVFGTRAVMLGGIELSRGVASSIADVIAEGIGLVAFMLLGLGILFSRAPHAQLIWLMGGGLLALLAGGAAGYWQRARLGQRQAAATLDQGCA